MTDRITTDRIEADYLIETAFDPHLAAEVMAGEQSSGTFVAVPGETPELKARAAARVEAVTVIGEVSSPSLPGAARPDGASIRRACVTLSWPLANLGPSLPNLMATVAGNLFELQQISGLRLLSLRLPAAFAHAYPGPRFGIDGTRRLTGVYGRPLIGTIVKPSVGLDPQATADLVDTLIGAGVDFIKDDELQSDGPACPFEARVRAVMPVLERNADRTGRKAMFAFNLTGDIHEMRVRHDLVRDLGGTCVMASVNSVGLAGMIELGRFADLPIHAHRNGWGYLSRAPLLGWSFPAWHIVWRLAGADHIHVNGLRNKFSEDDDSVIASARACLTPLWEDTPMPIMPVFSSGQTPAQASDTWQRLGSADLIYAAGGGILGHPNGPTAGVHALREAWEAAMATPLAAR
jgi:ribulose-bisphosphate carboxylase large chain